MTMRKFMIRTRRIQNGRFNYHIEYKQYQMEVIDMDTGEKSKQLVHQEIVKWWEFPFTFGTSTQFGLCDDVGKYYRE